MTELAAFPGAIRQLRLGIDGGGGGGSIGRGHPLAARISRIAHGHPEGYPEVLGAPCTEIAADLTARVAGRPPSPDCLPHGIRERVGWLHSVETYVASHEFGRASLTTAAVLADAKSTLHEEIGS
jgi:hypothetical protein